MGLAHNYLFAAAGLACAWTVPLIGNSKGVAAEQNAQGNKFIRGKCAGRDKFTVSGFDGRNRHDGCYSRADSLHGLPLFSLNGKKNTTGLVVAATDLDTSPRYAYWTIRDVGGDTVCVDFDFAKATFEAHPTQVSNWNCQGDGKSSMFTEAEFSVACGCSNNIKARGIPSLGIGSNARSGKAASFYVVVTLLALGAVLCLLRLVSRSMKRLKRAEHSVPY